ncbi:hypothetical protein CR513_13741, partial [Mucuna pruriens]
FKDDTLITIEMSYKNVCVIKEILQFFEVTSSMKTTCFLNCKIGALPCVFFSISIRANLKLFT